MTQEISLDKVNQLAATYDNQPINKLAQRAVVKNGILAASENQEGAVQQTPVFSIDLETGKVANQKQSGRCWLFAALNTFRHDIANKINLKDFELSQNYLFFWDKFEKANYFYENIIRTAGEELTSRKVAFLLQTPQQDGGQWDMLVSLVEKYGVVPKSVMPESFNSSVSRDLNTYLNKKLRKDAQVLREMIAGGKSVAEVAVTKEQLLAEIYHLLATSLGTPPNSFDFEYRTSEGDYFHKANLTPQSFYEEFVGIDLSDYVSVINAPTADKPYNQLYTVEMLGNVVGGREVCHLNVDMATLKEATIKQLSAGESVWFGCDVGQSSTRDSGIMATDIYKVDETLQIDFQTSKADRLDYGESLMTHAMVITGVNIVADQPTKWKVENSWGEKVGDKGYFVMSDSWMDEFTYQVVIRKEFLSAELQGIIAGNEKIMLAPWDPMGALA